MTSPSTANDDHPGPTGRRHTSTGGEADQSVATRTPRAIPVRPAPRKPGQSADVSCSRETGAAAALGALLGAGAGEGEALAAGAGASDGDAAGSGVVTATGSLAACASSFSSGVGDHRQARSLSKSLVTPPVRSSVNAPNATSRVP